MSTAHKTEWLMAESLVEPEDAFVLWMVDRGTCRSHDEFRAQFGEQFPLNDVIERLIERGLIHEDDGTLSLTELARDALAVLESESDFDLEEILDLEMYAPLSRSASATVGAALSMSEDIWHSTVALQDPDQPARSPDDDRIRSYILLRVNALLLLREGLYSIFAEMMARFWPPAYHRSLSMMAIQKALVTGPEHAFELAKILLQYVIDPSLLGMAADLAGRLERVGELEDAIRRSKYVDRFRHDLDLPGNVWTYAYLERLGLEELARSLRDE